MGNNLVIVAIPDENDRVWKVSSEKVPHLTLLFLGEAEKVKNVQQIVEFVEHAATTMLNRFYLSVDRRDTLGTDEADVLFFRKGGYDVKAVREFRNALLKDSNIKTAYDSAEQFEGWTPHLTLGYPATPAKEIPDNESDRFYDVSFNKIAVWMGDSEGPEFLLKDYWDEIEAVADVPMDVAMSSLSQNDVRVQAGMKALEEYATEDESAKIVVHGAAFAEGLMHYGVKGMKWGHRSTPSPAPVAPSAQSRVPNGQRRKTQITVEGGHNQPAHHDAIKVAEAKAKLVKSGPSALSNQELRDVATRVQLEQQVRQLVTPSGKRFVKSLLGQQGNQAAQQVVSTQVKRKLATAALL